MGHDVLIVDDEADIRLLIGGILEDEGYTTRGAADTTRALEAIRERRPSLCILDVWLQGSAMDGLQLLDLMVAEYPTVPVVIISGHGNIETAVGAIKRGAYDFIEKPFKSDRLLLVAARAIEAARLRRENEELRSRVGDPAELIGVSGVVASMRQAVERVAPTNSRVLVTGPAGVGKEVIARQIHGRSRRAAGPFVIMNCASMRPERVEIELFGQEGEGGQGPRAGLFEQAHGGTLLLDEVADMPPETQGKIVRALQEQTFERVGGRTRVAADVRVMSTSSRDLQSEIANGRFREDLYYRLNVVQIRVPPLRDRREDIAELARHFMARTASGAAAARGFGEDAIAAMQAYDWPGNVRQLRNVVEWLQIMAPGDPAVPIRADMLPPEIGAIMPATLRGEHSAEIMGLPLREARELFERQYLVAQVTRFAGNISRTATFVGMERSALHRKLKMLGVHGTDRPGQFDS
jgi:two-component system nitrogen regulation response regulator NtrX